MSTRSESKGWRLDSTPRGGATSRLYLGLMIGFIAGLGVGMWLSQPDDWLGSEVAARPASVDSPEPRSILGETDAGAGGDGSVALAEALLINLQLASRIHSLEALIEYLDERDTDPLLLSRHLISQFDRDGLKAFISMATGLGADDLDRVEDVDAFATRLSEIAMEGTMFDGPVTSDAPRVWFGRDASVAGDRSMGTHTFDSSKTRIYAFFSPGEYSGRQVMVKWYQTDEQKILLLERHNIGGGRESDYVWLEPGSGWERGDYQVDIYSGDEAMERLALGRYSVR